MRRSGVVIAGASTYGILWHLMFFLFGEFDPEDQQNGYTATKAEDAHGCKSAAYQKISHMGHVPPKYQTKGVVNH